MKSESSFYKVGPKPFVKDVEVPTSKSFANRIIVLAALSERSIRIDNIPESTDVKNMLSCLSQIGLEIDFLDNEVTIHNSFPECEVSSAEVINLETGDGGTTNRFLIPLLALGQNTYNLIPAEKMFERPMDELDETLSSLGIEVTRNSETWFKLKGPYKLDRHVIDVDCSRSTQFATGLALSLSKLHAEVNPVSLISSRPYWEMSEELIKRSREQDYFTVPADFSSLSYPLALAAVGGSITITNCSGVDRYQADSEFIPILEKVGVDLDFTEVGLKVEGKKSYPGFNHDCRNCPDLVPTLCFLAAYAQGETKLENVDVLRHKECDRLAEMMRMMDAFQVNYRYDKASDVLSVFGGSTISNSIEYTPPVDHRMVMVAYLFLRFNGGGKVYNHHCVDKSFPQFFKELDE